ncbi:MAG: hypothetical protein H6641_14825 [Caldilineaceae bacterium]|nr:hypothetical protein [Caldilineaceae bacterium]
MKTAQVPVDGKVVTRFTICGVQASEFTGIPATGKSAAVTAIGSQRIVESRLNCMMQELGDGAAVGSAMMWGAKGNFTFN